MSVIDTATHTVVAYESGKTKPLNGQRLASFSWKTSNDKDSLWFGIKRPSKAVSVPHLTAAQITENMHALAPHLITYLESVQDKIIREMLESSDNLLHVSQESIDVPAILEYLEDSNESGRLTKDTVKVWFKEKIADSLMVQLAEKLGVGDEPTSEDSAKIEKIVAAFEGKVASLAGGKTSYDAATAKQLQKCISLVPEGDVIADKFTVRLQRMIDAPEVSLLDAL